MIPASQVVEHHAEHPAAVGHRIEVGDLVIKKLNSVYADVEQGEILALINSSNWLEIAVHQGRASQYTGLGIEEIFGAEVRIKKAKEPL